MATQYLLNKKNGGTFKTTVIPSIDVNKFVTSNVKYGNEIEVNKLNTRKELDEFTDFFYKQSILFSIGSNSKECYDIGYYTDELINDEYSKFLSNLTSSKYKFLILQNGTIIGISVVEENISGGSSYHVGYVCACPNFLSYKDSDSNHKGKTPIWFNVLFGSGGFEGIALQKLKFFLCNDFLYKWNPYRYEYVDFKLSPAFGCVYKAMSGVYIKEKLWVHNFDYMTDNSMSVNNLNSLTFQGTSLSMTTEQWGKVCFTSEYDKFTKFYGNPNEPLPNDPYEDESKPGGGGGGHDDGTDPIPLPDLPTISATDSGFITLFTPSQQQVRALASYMWSGTLFDIDNFKKIFANPMDCILGFSIVPLTVASQGVAQVKVGNISTDFEFPVVANQYVEVDCGSVEVSEYWGAYMDYSPYTKVSIFLPFIGTLPIDVDEIMSRTISVKYHVDLISGSCVAYILVSGGRLNSVLYQYSGQISSSIPITSDSYESIIRGAIDIATTLTSGATRTASSVVGGNLHKNPIGGKLDGVAIASETVGSAANTVMTMKPDIMHSGAVSGSSAIMSMRKPYLIIERPNACIPLNQNSYTGYPAYITSQLGKLNGMTVVDVIHLDDVIATEEELNMIESLLKGGVIL